MILKLLGFFIVATLFPCLYYSFKKHGELKKADQFEGTVVAHEPREGHRGSTIYALKIVYRDEKTKLQTFTTDSAGYPVMGKIGQKITVFRHADGKRHDILLFQDLFLIYWLWFCIGLAIMGCFVFPTFLKVIYFK